MFYQLEHSNAIDKNAILVQYLNVQRRSIHRGEWVSTTNATATLATANANATLATATATYHPLFSPPTRMEMGQDAELHAINLQQLWTVDPCRLAPWNGCGVCT